MSRVETARSETVFRPRRRPLFLAGVLLFLLGPPIYVVQFQGKLLFAPWYVPIMASIGVVLMVVSVWRRRGVARTIGMALFVVICVLEWFLLAAGTATPLYSGPAEPGRTVSAFTSNLADGTPFTEKELKQGSPTVLLFFRGRW
jgi:hypothetical protein